MAFDMNAWETELRRGIVEMCLLAILKAEEGYGYEIIERMKARTRLELTESTVYPMLARLAKDGLLATRQARSPHGPPRRYFRLTALGRDRLLQMANQWKTLDTCVSQLLAE